MSSILKALKKLEDETSGQEIQGNHLPRKIDTRQTVNQRVKGVWIVNKLFSILAVVVITSGLIWAGFSLGPGLKAKFFPESEIITKNTTQSENTRNEENAEEKKSISTVNKPSDTMSKTETDTPAELPQPRKSAPLSEPERQKPMNSKPDIKPLKYSEKPHDPFRQNSRYTKSETKEPGPSSQAVSVYKPSKSEGSVRNISPEPVKVKPPPIPVIAPPKEEKVKKSPEPRISQPDVSAAFSHHDSIPEKSKQEAGMSIQALVWSPEPKSRMAVINGNIVREGGSVDGAVITYIGNNYIVFRQGGAEWKLVFELN